MQKERIQDLIAAIGGLLLPGENTKSYLTRVSLKSGVHYDCVYASFYGRYTSANSLEKYKKAAQDADHTKDIARFNQFYLRLFENNPELHRGKIDAMREFLARLQRDDERDDEETRGFDLQVQRETSSEGK
jgi:hypothetical protein